MGDQVTASAIDHVEMELKKTLSDYYLYSITSTIHLTLLRLGQVFPVIAKYVHYNCRKSLMGLA